jgi:hypothetical protein
MANQVGDDPNRVELEDAGGHVVKVDTGQISDPDREQRWREIAAESLLNGLGGRDRPPDVDVDLGVEERGEEREPEDVVHVEMREEHVDSIQSVGVLSQAPDPGAGVEV